MWKDGCGLEETRQSGRTSIQRPSFGWAFLSMHSHPILPFINIFGGRCCFIALCIVIWKFSLRWERNSNYTWPVNCGWCGMCVCASVIGFPHWIESHPLWLLPLFLSNSLPLSLENFNYYWFFTVIDNNSSVPKMVRFIRVILMILSIAVESSIRLIKWV